MVLLLSAGLTHVWGMAGCWLTAASLGITQLCPTCLCSSSKYLSIPGKDRDAGDSKLKHAKLWSFADVVSANIPLGKASHMADPRVKKWVRFPTVRKYHMQSLLVKEGRIGSSLQSTAHLVIWHLGQFSVTRIHKQNMAWPRPENTHNSEQSGVTTYCVKDLFNQWCPGEKECQFEALIYPSLFPDFKWNIPHLLVSICITLCYVPRTSQQYSGIILPAAEGEWCPASFSFLHSWWRGHMGPSNSKLSKLKLESFSGLLGIQSVQATMFLAEPTNDWTEANKPNRCFSKMFSKLPSILRILKRPIHLPQIALDALVFMTNDP